MTKTTTIDPSEFTPDFDNIPGDFTAVEFPFWLGVTADCPRHSIDVAGLHFPAANERIVKNETTGKQVRVPEHGTLNFTVTRQHVEALRRDLKRFVVRFRDHPAVTNDGTGENIGDPVERARRGKLIKIPTQEQIDASVKSGGRAFKPYIKQPGDRPAADYMYFIHVPDRVRGREIRTISETGIVWPEELAEIDEILS